MSVDNFLYLIFLPLLAHSSLTFLQVLLKNKSQYSDYLNIEIEYEANKQTLLRILLLKVNDDYTVKDLFLLALVWLRYLKALAVLPILIYIASFILLASKSLFKEEINYDEIIIILWLVALLLQLLYVILKIKSRLPEILQSFHNGYSTKELIWIILDFAPICK